MHRFWAGLMIALGCHILFFLVPVNRQPVKPSRLPQTNRITVRFNPLQPPTPQQVARVIPLPPDPISPLEKRVEKPPPKKAPPPKPKPKPKTVPKPRKVKKKKAPDAKPPEPLLPPSGPQVQKESATDDTSKPINNVPPVARPNLNAPPSVATAPVTPVLVSNIPPPMVRKAYPKNEGNPPPPYPVLARRRGWEGTVDLSVMVLENGQVGDISVEKSSGYPLLDETALKTVSKYHFVPGLSGDQAVVMRVKVPVHFRLRDTN